MQSNDTDRTLRKRLAQVYTIFPRVEHRHNGKLVPVALRDRLVKILASLRWPAKRHRTSVRADHYAVIWRGRPRAGLEDLYAGCHELITWADPLFQYTHIAVTKNFVGSPHKDVLDQSYQYTVSLGNFTSGGQLCVEEPGLEAKSSSSASAACGEIDGHGNGVSVLHVVNTHDRMAVWMGDSCIG